MRKLLLVLVVLVLISGCTESELDTAITNMPQTKAFLEEYPEAKIVTTIYSPIAIKHVAEEFIQDCPSLGEEGKSYYKVTITDEPSKQQLVMWLETREDEFVCAIRTSTAEATTTTLPPTTTTLAATTTAQATTTTTTIPPTTTTMENVTTTTQNISTTTTVPAGPLPDLFVSNINITKYPGYGSWGAYYHNITYTISNAGTATSNSTLARITILNATAGNTTYFNNVSSIKSLGAGESVTVNALVQRNVPKGNYIIAVTADASNDTASYEYNNTEVNEANNNRTLVFPVPLSTPSQANLVISFIQLKSGYGNNVSYTMKNIGTETAYDVQTIVGLKNNTGGFSSMCGTGYSTMVPNQTNSSWCWTSGTIGGTVYGIAIIDYYNATLEPNEFDNENSTTAS